MPAETPGKPRASPPAGAPGKPRSAAEHRKSSKPVMEKRRRARINESLAQLKTLVLDAFRKDSSRHSKLEKADILEITVRHLQSLRRVQVTAALGADPAVLGKYRAGFNECLAEVNRFLAGCEGVPADEQHPCFQLWRASHPSPRPAWTPAQSSRPPPAVSTRPQWEELWPQVCSNPSLIRGSPSHTPHSNTRFCPLHPHPHPPAPRWALGYSFDSSLLLTQPAISVSAFVLQTLRKHPLLARLCGRSGGGV
uniref:Hes family bHLH transcription factor 4 n=1 Tax=Felis catus TaxID=9685 RepID=A0ABI8AIB1_FELCA